MSKSIPAFDDDPGAKPPYWRPFWRGRGDLTMAQGAGRLSEAAP